MVIKIWYGMKMVSVRVLDRQGSKFAFLLTSIYLFICSFSFGIYIYNIDSHVKMEPDTESPFIQVKKTEKNKSYARSWQQFTNRSMQLLVENPTSSKFVLKYLPKTHKFILKVTDGFQVVLKKCKGQQLDEIQKFTVYAGRAFTNESNKKKVEEVVEQKKEANKKKNKKKK